MELYSRVPVFFHRKLVRIRSGKSLRSPKKTKKTTTRPGDALSHSQPLEDAFPKPENSFTVLPCRIHTQNDKAQAAAEHFYQEEAVRLLVNDYGRREPSLKSPIGHSASLFFPECLPERLETVAIVLEICAIQDGMLPIFFSDHPLENYLFAIDVLESNSSAKKDLKNAMNEMKPATGASSRSDIAQKFFSEKFLDIAETYGKDGQILLQKCRTGCLETWASESVKRPVTFEDYMVQRVREFGLS